MNDMRKISHSVYKEKLPENPQTFTQKLRWKMKHDRRPILTLTADKYQVTRYLEERGFGNLLTKLLRTMGFKKVKNLRGGIDEWAEKFDPDMPRY